MFTVHCIPLEHDINVPLKKLSSLNRSVDTNWKQTPVQYGGGAEANVEVSLAALSGMHITICLI